MIIIDNNCDNWIITLVFVLFYKESKALYVFSKCIQHLKAIPRVNLQTEYQSVQQGHTKLCKIKKNKHPGYRDSTRLLGNFICTASYESCSYLLMYFAEGPSLHYNFIPLSSPILFFF